MPCLSGSSRAFSSGTSQTVAAVLPYWARCLLLIAHCPSPVAHCPTAGGVAAEPEPWNGTVQRQTNHPHTAPNTDKHRTINYLVAAAVEAAHLILGERSGG